MNKQYQILSDHLCPRRDLMNRMHMTFIQTVLASPPPPPPAADRSRW